MEMFNLVFGASVFLAGILTFLAPCTLPLIPSYIAFIGGVEQRRQSDKAYAGHARLHVIMNSLAFIAGFSIVFILFGVLIGLFGSLLGHFRSLLSQIGGVLIIFFGLYMLDVFKFIPLTREFHVSLPSFMRPGNPVSSFGMGATFALGWTPCVGPVLASVLLVASSSASAIEGGLLLAIFSLGLALPFFLTALLYVEAHTFFLQLGHASKIITRIGGVFLIVLGVLLLTSNFGLLLEYGYRLFDLIGIEGIYKFL